MDYQAIEQILREHGYSDIKWMRGGDFIVSQWVRFKCMYGCPSFGQKGTCPPSAPSIAECREFFSEYEKVLAIHIPLKLADPEERNAWSRGINLDLLKVERRAFLAGFPKAFLLFMDECCICSECTGTLIDCKHPKQARPSAEALGVDVFGTVRKLGFPIEVLTHFSEEMNRYAFLLLA
jgi:predicted metal-binding protein